MHVMSDGGVDPLAHDGFIKPFGDNFETQMPIDIVEKLI